MLLHTTHPKQSTRAGGSLVVRDLPPLAKGGGGRVANENLGRAETLAEGLEPLRWNEASRIQEPVLWDRLAYLRVLHIPLHAVN